MHVSGYQRISPKLYVIFCFIILLGVNLVFMSSEAIFFFRTITLSNMLAIVSISRHVFTSLLYKEQEKGSARVKTAAGLRWEIHGTLLPWSLKPHLHMENSSERSSGLSSSRLRSLIMLGEESLRKKRAHCREGDWFEVAASSEDAQVCADGGINRGRRAPHAALLQQL